MRNRLRNESEHFLFLTGKQKIKYEYYKTKLREIIFDKHNEQTILLINGNENVGFLTHLNHAIQIRKD